MLSGVNVIGGFNAYADKLLFHSALAPFYSRKTYNKREEIRDVRRRVRFDTYLFVHIDTNVFF